MNRSDFARLLDQLGSLSPKQRTQVQGVLTALPDTAPSAVACIIPGPEACPHCQAPAEQLRPWGYSHGLARMRCHSCGRTSNALTGAHPWRTCVGVSNGCTMRRP